MGEETFDFLKKIINYPRAWPLRCAGACTLFEPIFVLLFPSQHCYGLIKLACPFICYTIIGVGWQGWDAV